MKTSIQRICNRRDAKAMRGVTLIELMVVIVIVGILAAIAYPSYQSQVQRTRRSDGQTALLQAAQELERCFTRYNSYTAGGCAVMTNLTDGDGRPSPEGWYVVAVDPAPTASTFRLVATPQNAQTSDVSCGNLTLTQLGVRQPANCW